MAISPLYTIHRYTDEIYKVIAFKGQRDPDAISLRGMSDPKQNDSKLENNFSRARSLVLQYALCNEWDYFFTGTLDQRKFDRFDLDTYSSRLSQFIRDKRKKYQSQIQVLLVPERHKDGAWHIHGLISGLPARQLRAFTPPAPQRLIDGGFLNWPDYQNTFGFCSLAPIRDPVATAFYITKYVSKDLSRRSGDVGKHLYFHSRPLKKAERASDIYFYQPDLEQYCTQDFDFVKTGMVQDASWSFPYQWDGVELPDLEPLYPLPAPLAPEPQFRPETIDPFYYQQLRMEI